MTQVVGEGELEFELIPYDVEMEEPEQRTIGMSELAVPHPHEIIPDDVSELLDSTHGLVAIKAQIDGPDEPFSYGAFGERQHGGFVAVFEDGRYYSVLGTGFEEPEPEPDVEATKPPKSAARDIAESVGIIAGMAAVFALVSTQFQGERPTLVPAEPVGGADQPEATAPLTTEQAEDLGITDEFDPSSLLFPDERPPIWGDGLPDAPVSVEAASTLHFEMGTQYNYHPYLAFDCEVFDEPQKAQPGDSIIAIGAARYPHPLEMYRAESLLGLANTQLNIERGVIDSVDDILDVGDEVFSVSDCTVTNHWDPNTEVVGTSRVAFQQRLQDGYDSRLTWWHDEERGLVNNAG